MSQTTSNLETNNVIEVRLLAKGDIEPEDLEYFVHNGWINFKTQKQPGYWTMIRRNPPLEAFEFALKVADYGADYIYED